MADERIVSEPISPPPLGESIYIPNTNIMSSAWVRWFESVRLRVEANSLNVPLTETFVATRGQTVFNTAVKTVSNTTRVNLEVYVGGLLASEGEDLDFQITGDYQLSFNDGLDESTVVVIKSYK